MSRNRTCAVPWCSSTKIKDPGKLFIPVPQCPECLELFLDLALACVLQVYVDPEYTNKASLYFCEDHFDLPNDMENYMGYKIMDSVGQIKMKPDCVPSQFKTDRTQHSPPPMDILQETYLEETDMPLTSGMTSNSDIQLASGNEDCDFLQDEDTQILNMLGPTDETNQTMADDIDIEEHNLLDNPRVRNMFPNLIQFKEEVIDAEEPEELSYEPFSESESETYQPHNRSCPLTFENTHEYPRHKIIIGTKPSSVTPVTIKKEPEEEKIEETLPKNRIILGTKPTLTSGTNDSENRHVLGTKPNDTTENRHILGTKPTTPENETTENRLILGTKPTTPENDSTENRLVLGTKPSTPENHSTENRLVLGTKPTTPENDSTENRLVLGTKPTTPENDSTENRLVLGTKPSTPENDSTENRLVLGTKPSTPENDSTENRLVLGTKPSTPEDDSTENRPILNTQSSASDTNDSSEHDDDEDDDEDEDSTEEVKPCSVILEQWGPKLDRSKCYCKECKILFATQNALDAHKMSAHSFLVALDTNKAVKSTARSSSVALNSGASNSNYKSCYHCNQTFSNDALIRHLYKYVKFTCNICESNFNNKTDLDIHKKRVHENASVDDSVNFDKNINDEVDDNDKMFYQCNVCGVFFKLKISYHKHLKKNHGIDSGRDEKVPYDGKCWFCPSVALNRHCYYKHNFRKHLDKHKQKHNFPIKKTVKAVAGVAKPNVMCEIATGNNKNPGTNTAVLAQDPFVKYQCRKCDEICRTYRQAGKHRMMRHPEMKNLNLFTKIITKKHQPSVCIKKPKLFSANIKNLSLPTPLKYIFKCATCPIHFTYCSSAMQHSKNCFRTKGEWKCNVCRRSFMLNDKPIHLRQHAVTERFQVLLCEINIYNRILNQCPNCKTYLHEREFFDHWRYGCHHPTSHECIKCNMNLHVSSLKSHNSFHQQYDAKDIIAITYDIDNSKKAVKRKSDEDFEEGNAKRSKQNVIVDNADERTNIYYCDICKCCMVAPRSVQLHNDGVCKGVFRRRRRICTICGLMVSSQRHGEFHESNKQLKLSDFKFIRLRDNAVTKPPMPDYPRCSRCDVRVCKKLSLANHDCNEKYKTCGHCNKKFSDLAFNLHVNLHDYSKKGSNTDAVVPRSSKPMTVAKVAPEPEIPELLKKYKMIVETWNVIFLCQTCDIIHDSYDSSVEHCQNHFHNLESYDIHIKECTICNLKFESKSYASHLTLHSRNKSLAKDHFKILTYEYQNLFSQSWLSMFEALPREQSLQILSQSIYKYCRKFKMTVISDGPLKYTVYLCGKCEKYVNGANVQEHKFQSECSTETKPFKCTKCSLEFFSQSERQLHEEQHRKTDRFRTVLFNAPRDEDYDFVLETQANISRKRPISRVSSGDATPTREYHYYRCKVCQCNLSQTKNIRKHGCSIYNQKKTCVKCRLHFGKRAFKLHNDLHEKNPDLTRKAIRITEFDPRTYIRTDSPESVTLKIFKCQSCGLHFMSSKNLEKHFSVCLSGKEISKETCSKCGLLFDAGELFNHSVKHHSKSTPVNFSIEECEPKLTDTDDSDDIEDHKDPLRTLYKCKDCNIYYLSCGAVRYHSVEINHRVDDAATCKDCGLVFTSQSLKKHTLIHHVENQFSLKDFIIIEKEFDESDSNYYNANKTTSKPTNKSQPEKEIRGLSPSASQVSKKFLAKLDLSKYNHVLYKCEKCNLHFMTMKSKLNHRKNATGKTCKSEVSVRCDICHFKFSSHILPRHKYIHHEHMKIKDFKIICSQKAETDLFKCTKCGLHFISANSLLSHKYRDCDVVVKKSTKFKTTCDICHFEFSNFTIKRHVVFHHNEKRMKANFNVDCDIYLFPNRDKYKESVVYTRNLYKCHICSVHLITESSLETHLEHGKHSEPKTKCSRCGLMFPEKIVKKHEQIQHDKLKLKLKNFKIHTKTDALIHKEVKQDVSDDKTPQGSHVRRALNNFQRYSNMVYKCAFCDCHFLRPNTLKDHMNINKHDSPTVRCSVCNLTFSQHTHEVHLHIQHEKLKLGPKDIQVIRTGKKHLVAGCNFYDHNLFKCDVCHVHFMTADNLDIHVNTGNHNIATEECSKCSLLFTQKLVDKHISIQHEELKLDKKSFVINCYQSNPINRIRPRIDYKETTDDSDQVENDSDQVENDSDQETQVENESDESSNQDNVSETTDASKSDFNLPMNLVFKCSICSVHYISESALETHFSKLKDTQHTKPLAPCTHCGLGFADASGLAKHVNMHHELRNLKLEDLKIIEFFEYGNVFTNNYLYRCKVCKIHFNKILALYDHDINLHKPSGDNWYNKKRKNTATCDDCHLKLPTVAVKRHKRVFHEIMRLKREDINIFEIEDGQLVLKEGNGRIVTEKNNDTPTTMDVDKKNEKYNSQVFKCSQCDLHFMKYTDVIVHKNKCNGEKNCGETCPLCGLSFESRTLEEHKDNHHKDSKDAFFVIDCSKNAIDNSAKKNHLEDSTKVRKNTKAITKITNSKKVKKSNGVKIFKCSKCLTHFLKRDSCNDHNHNMTTLQNCDECGLKFSRVSLTKHRRLHHKELNLKLEDFEIIVIDVGDDETDSDDESSDDESSEDESSEDETVDKETNETDDDLTGKSNPRDTKNDSNTSLNNDTSGYDNKVYCCEKCSSCWLNLEHIRRHKKSCSGRMLQKECDICNISYALRSLPKHKKIHHDMLNLTKDDMQIVYSETDAEKVTKTVETNENVDNHNSSTTSELSDVSTLNKNLYTKQLYKCKICDIYFMSEKEFNIHNKDNKHPLKGYRCVTCLLHFSLSTLATHIFVHHEKMKLKSNDFVILYESGISGTSNEPKPGTSKEKEQETGVGKSCDEPKEKEQDTGVGKNTEKLDVTSETKDNDSNVVGSSNDFDSSVENFKGKAGKEKEKNKKRELRLYMCAVCNVCYIKQNACYKHVLKHEVLDSKDYIECKLCAFQFKILSLHKHIKLHHCTEFDMDNVLIEEYHPTESGNPKRDIYFAKDKLQVMKLHNIKLQSLQISTTTESKNKAESSNKTKDDETKNTSDNSRPKDNLNNDSVSPDSKSQSDNSKDVKIETDTINIKKSSNRTKETQKHSDNNSKPKDNLNNDSVSHDTTVIPDTKSQSDNSKDRKIEIDTINIKKSSNETKDDETQKNSDNNSRPKDSLNNDSVSHDTTVIPDIKSQSDDSKYIEMDVNINIKKEILDIDDDVIEIQDDTSNSLDCAKNTAGVSEGVSTIALSDQNNLSENTVVQETKNDNDSVSHDTTVIPDIKSQSDDSNIEMDVNINIKKEIVDIDDDVIEIQDDTSNSLDRAKNTAGALSDQNNLSENTVVQETKNDKETNNANENVITYIVDSSSDEEPEGPFPNSSTFVITEITPVEEKQDEDSNGDVIEIE